MGFFLLESLFSAVWVRIKAVMQEWVREEVTSWESPAWYVRVERPALDYSNTLRIQLQGFNLFHVTLWCNSAELKSLSVPNGVGEQKFVCQLATPPTLPQPETNEHFCTSCDWLVCDSETDNSTSHTNGSLGQWDRGLYILYQWQPGTVRQRTLHLIPMAAWDSEAVDSTSHTNENMGQQSRGLYISHQWLAGTARQGTLHLTPMASWGSKAEDSTSHTNCKLGQQGRRVYISHQWQAGTARQESNIAHQWQAGTARQGTLHLTPMAYSTATYTYYFLLYWTTFLLMWPEYEATSNITLPTVSSSHSHFCRLRVTLLTSNGVKCWYLQWNLKFWQSSEK